MQEPADPGEYYKSHGDESVCDAFKNFDDLHAFFELDDRVRHHGSRNFVVDFGDDAAYCGFDLAAESVGDLLVSPRPAALHTRWINVWLPHEQTDLITTLARHFDFSPRLLGFMLSQPTKKTTVSHSTKRSTMSRFRRRNLGRSVPSVPDPSTADIEAASRLGNTRPALSSEIDLTKAFNQYSLADEVWHWSTVDWGRRFLCLGYNSLYPCAERHYSRPTLDDANDEDRDNWRDHDLPEGKRVWSWLLLCEDKTVVSIHEDPFPHRHGALDASELRSLSVIRRNLINVFRNCSKACQDPRAPAVTRLPVRHRVGDSDEETAHRPADVPGMLFYCLFDDWYSSYSIVFRREHRYAHELEQLRAAMMRRAALSHINRLHHIGRQLGVLKRMYQSYELLIENVLAKQEPTLASLKNSRVISPSSAAGDANANANGLYHSMHSVHSSSGAGAGTGGVPHVTESESLLGVALSSAARVRFERLRHRIRLYALSEIDACVAQRDALVMMNFNLIAILESSSVEQLTRITLLLAKVTILFMPVSLMSAYFGANLSDATFESGDYWRWFGVVFAASVVGLTVFSVMSGTFEGGTVYNFSRGLLTDCFGGLRGKRVSKGAEGDG